MTTRPCTPSDASLPFEEEERPLEDRLQDALETWRAANGTLGLSYIARRFGVPRSTLNDRIAGRIPRKKQHQGMQRLTTEEEDSLKRWIKRLQAWGWPPRVEQTYSMATELLRAKGVTKPLGINWSSKFMTRHPDLKAIYIPPLGKERTMA